MRKIIIPLLLAALTACNDHSTIEPLDPDLTLRQISTKYYINENFRIGAETFLDNYKESSPKWFGTTLNAEFPKADFDKECHQVLVLPNLNNPPQTASMIQSADYARKQMQVLSFRTEISDDCSTWAKDPSRSNEELSSLIHRYLGAVCEQAQTDKDVVKWLIIASNPDQPSIVWDRLGKTPVQVDGQTINLPNYLIDAARIASQKAPDVKRLIALSMDNIDATGNNRWIEARSYLMALRQLGYRIDGLQWDAQISLGWESKAENSRNLELLVDWCYLNDAQFHISGLNVLVTKKNQPALVRDTREEQTKSLMAIAKIVIGKAGRGAYSCSFQPLDRFVEGKGHYASLFVYDAVQVKYNRNPAYWALHSELLNHKKR